MSTLSVGAAFVVLLGATLFATSVPRGNASVLAATRPERSGVLVPGARRIAEGHVSSGTTDAQDTFAFTTGTACTVRVRLVPSLPGTDLELRLGDRPLGASAELTFPTTGAEVELSVRSSWGSSDYVLQVEALPCAEFVSDPAP
ncbi:MAG TPA: hypothetical protein VGR31_17205 [Planctomycetota bacterium]|jgi:hypothetical protein|nr:hypothetical protein [Planctomycetota bacterium]